MKVSTFAPVVFGSLWILGSWVSQAQEPESSLPSTSMSDGHLAVTQSADPNYVLSTNDYVQITVYQQDDLTTDTRVSPAGVIALPLVGSLTVGGLKVSEASDLIRSKLMDGYLRDPKVTITIVEFAQRRFSVLGQIQKPGSYEMPQQEKVSILDAIALAGGYTPIANPSKVTVRRNEGGKEQIYNLNAKKIAADSSQQPFYLQAGDVVTVSESIF
jgi:protein involved in polysaccharide export with SLBB domain